MKGPVSLRSARTVAGPLALLAVTGAVLGAATTLSVTLTADAGARTGTVLPLLVLALVVVPVVALEPARRRRDVTALARVRGAGGERMVLLAGGLPVTAVLAGAAVGTGAAAAVETPDATATTWAAAVAVGAALLAAAVAWRTAREPLAAALRRPVRSRPAGPWVVVGLVAVTVISALAVYLALSDGGTDAGDLVLAGSGVLGVAAGEVVVRVVARASALADGRRSPAVVMALRAATGPEQRGRLRAVVAAGVVAAGALTATLGAGAWADGTARLRVGGPTRLALPESDALGALRLTRALDPDGRWLMAGAVADERQEAELRVAWLDLSRYDRVSGDALDGTPAALSDDDVRRLLDATPVETVTGDEVTVTASGPARVELDHLDPGGAIATAVLEIGPDGTGRADVACADGCVVLGLSADVAVEITALDLGTTDLLASGWAPSATTDPAVAATPGPVSLQPGDSLAPVDAVAAVPVLSAGDPDWADGPEIVGIGGVARAATPLGARPALPIVGAAGLVADLPVALAGAGGSVAKVRPVVVARADTPAPLLADLRDAGATGPVTPDTDAAFGTTARAELRARRVVAGGAALLALLAVLAGWRRRVTAARRERAAMRLVSVPPRDLRAAALVEAGVLGAVVVVGVLLGDLLAARTVVDGSGLVPTGSSLPSFAAATSPATAVVAALLAALGAAAAVALVGLGVRRAGARHSEPRVLLEDSRDGAPDGVPDGVRAR